MRYYLSFFLWLIAIDFSAQSEMKKVSSKMKEVKVELEEAVKSNDNSSLAKSLAKSAELYKAQRNFSKSEEYYKKAIEEYRKLSNTAEVARLSRELAIVQESQNKKKEAVSSYKQSKTIQKSDKDLEKLNDNDIQRLEVAKSEAQPTSAPAIQQERELIQSNIDLSIKNNNAPEVQNGYYNLGKTQLKENDKKGAIESFNSVYKSSISGNTFGNSSSSQLNSSQSSANKPLKESNANTALAQEANQKIAEIYLQDKNYDKAIETKKLILKEPLIAQNLTLKVSETQKLAEIYHQKNETETALDLLKSSYRLSIQNHLTLEAKSSLEKISEIYKSQNKTNELIPFYENFLKELPALIEKDTNLIEATIIKETEEKISQLIQEKELKDQLLEKKNMFNYFLIGFIAILLGAIGFILYTLKAIKKKNIEIELQSLRREMNPHFIFNSLNSINQFISQQDEVSANSYLTKFSKLMRGVMENSKDDFIFLEKEIEVLENYLQLEKSRFSDKFNFSLEVDPRLYDLEDVKIPSMLIQPFIENAIWHGLRYVSEMGWLRVKFLKNENEIEVTVEDNGVGIEKSKALKTKHQSQHKGRGMTNTEERIKLLNALYHLHIRYEIIDKKGEETGVLVSLKFRVGK